MLSLSFLIFDIPSYWRWVLSSPSMLGLLQILSIAGCATAKLHHLYVGHDNSAAIHALEIDDETRTVIEMGIIPASGASPSLTLDVCAPSL